MTVRSAIVLAGGRSARMGRDKATLDWDGQTLLQRVCSQLEPTVEDLLVVGGGRQSVPLGARFHADERPGAHALGGLYTGLRASTSKSSFVCGCDQPFINASLVERLFELALGFDLVAPEVAGELQPLHAVYARSLAPTIEDLIERKSWSLKQLANEAHTRVVAESEIRKIDPELKSFVNLNTHDEYERALAEFQSATN